jgi:hypothetical protein
VSRLAWCVALALAVGMLAGVAWAQDGHGRGGPPRECVGGARVVRPARPVPASMRACSTSSECVLAGVGCCSPCSVPEPAQLRAVNRGQQSAWRRRTCPQPQACPACVAGPPAPTTHAACVSHRCEMTTDDATCGAASPFGQGVS